MHRSFLLACALLVSTVRADDGWQRTITGPDLTVEHRDVAGSDAHELRVAAHARATPAAVLAVLWDHTAHPAFVPYVKRVDVLRDDGDTKLVYEQIHVPILKDRDVVFRVRRRFTPDGGVWELRSDAVSDEGPPADTSHTRIRLSRGSWRLTPTADGGTDVVYTILTDAGGFLPAWVVNRAQRDAGARLVRAMLTRAEATSARPPASGASK